MWLLLPTLQPRPRHSACLGNACSSLLCSEDPSHWTKHRLREPLTEALFWVAERIQGPRGTRHGVSHTWKTRMELTLTSREEKGCFQATFSDRNPLHSLSYKPSLIGALPQQPADVPVALIHFQVHTERGQDVPLCQPLVGRLRLQRPQQPHRLHAQVAAPQRRRAAEVELAIAPRSVASVGLEKLPALVHQAGPEGDGLLGQETLHTDLHGVIEQAPGRRQDQHLRRHPSSIGGERSRPSACQDTGCPGEDHRKPLAPQASNFCSKSRRNHRDCFLGLAGTGCWEA